MVDSATAAREGAGQLMRPSEVVGHPHHLVLSATVHGPEAESQPLPAPKLSGMNTGASIS